MSLPLFSYHAKAQCNVDLGDYWGKDLRDADSLLLNAESVYDTFNAIYKYEPVANVNKYAPAYMKLGQLYKHFGSTRGIVAFSIAEDFFLKCKKACVDSTESVDRELKSLNITMQKYREKPYKYVGTWGYYRNDGSFVPCVDITYNGKKYIFHLYPNLYEYSGMDEVIYSQVYVDTSKREITYTFEYKVSCGGCYRGLSEYADKGYSKTRSPQYMTERLVTETNAVYFSGDVVCIKFLQFHEERFVDGIKTYSATGKNTRKPLVLYLPTKDVFQLDPVGYYF